MENTADIKCPGCGSSRLCRYGKTAAGRQKWRCVEGGCRRQFVPGSTHLLDQGEKDAVLRLLATGFSPRKIQEAFPKISKRWIYELKRRIDFDRER